MKYQITLHKTKSQVIEVEADSPHEAATKTCQNFKGWQFEDVSEIKEEDGEEVEAESFLVVSNCKNCSKFILEGDKCFIWGGEDTCYTCFECGGHDETHLAEVAE